MKVKRQIASLPFRSTSETWEVIAKLVTGKDTVDAAQLTAAASIAAMAIADEHAASTPILVRGEAPRLVIYTAHGVNAMELGAEIDSLSWNPTGGPGWAVSIPCDADDVEWMNAALRARAPRVSVYDASAGLEEEAPSAKKAADVEINWAGLGKP